MRWRTLSYIMNRILTLLFATVLLCIMPSCNKKDEPFRSKAKRTVLIYAVASNNLASYLVEDKDEMLRAAPNVSGLGSDVRLLLYSVASQSASEATLSELSKTPSGEWAFQELKCYDRNTFSTDPERMGQVFSDVRTISPSDSYGLIFWSHGTGWIPNFSNHDVPEDSSPKRSYGVDKYLGVTDYCDLDELAQAVPDRMFDYIWFDLCYMMGVEVVYQLRNKCDYIAGYPTEDWSPGMNYETTLPMLVAPKPDLSGVGKAFFDYYNSRDMAVTVTVMSTSGLERLSRAAADIYAAGQRPSSPTGMMNYSRLKSGLYDFGQFTKKYLSDTSSDSNGLIKAFDEALASVTLYAACSSKNFNGVEGAFDPDQYSGLSCHFPDSGTLMEEEYYKSLEWTKAVNP